MATTAASPGVEARASARALIAGRPDLYYHVRSNYFECLSCHEEIEVPRMAHLKIGGEKAFVRIAGQPENLLLWLEMHTLDHALCHLYKDAEQAKAAREFRKERARLLLVGGKSSATRPGRCGCGSGASADLIGSTRSIGV